MARGRKVHSNGEQSKRLLLEKAIELFSEKGYHETKVSRIVEAANFTQPTFYLYFKSKDALYQDINKQFQSDFDDIIKEWGVANTQHIEIFPKVLEHKLTTLFTYMNENPQLTKIGFFESAQAWEVKAHFGEQIIRLLEQHDYKRFYQASSIDIRLFAESFVGSLERLILTNLLSEKSQPHELARDLVRIYFP